MNPRDITSVELIGEAAATRAAFKLLLEAAQIFLASSKAEDKSTIVRALAAKLSQQRGELLAPMPIDASPELQAHGNRAFQREFERLASLITDRLNEVAAR
jgi:hypothetical protein